MVVEAELPVVACDEGNHEDQEELHLSRRGLTSQAAHATTLLCFIDLKKDNFNKGCQNVFFFF